MLFYPAPGKYKRFSLFPGNFTGPNDLNLILAKVNHVEVLSVTPEGLRPVKQFTINGKVDVIKFFRPPVGPG
jgi:DNA damage-binding protein 1